MASSRGGNRSRTSGQTAARALAGADDGGSVRVMIGGVGEAICGLDLVDDIVESLFPHAERAHRSAGAAEAS